jgi:hypothetical protein
MVICLSFHTYQSGDNHQAIHERWAIETNTIAPVMGIYTNMTNDYPVNYKNRKAIKQLQPRLALLVPYQSGSNFKLPNFWGKKWENLIQFLFHKKQKGKNFFLEKNW